MVTTIRNTSRKVGDWASAQALAALDLWAGRLPCVHPTCLIPSPYPGIMPDLAWDKTACAGTTSIRSDGRSWTDWKILETGSADAPLSSVWGVLTTRIKRAQFCGANIHAVSPSWPRIFSSITLKKSHTFSAWEICYLYFANLSVERGRAVGWSSLPSFPAPGCVWVYIYYILRRYKGAL